MEYGSPQYLLSERTNLFYFVLFVCLLFSNVSFAVVPSIRILYIEVGPIEAYRLSKLQAKFHRLELA